MDLKLQFGLRDDELLTIDDVERGLACNCVCPACNQPLVARKGAINQPHFAHYNSEDCNQGIETALHRRAKELIANSKTFTIPRVQYNRHFPALYTETEIPIDNVWLEKRKGRFIPDLIVVSKGKKLWIEIAVTHRVPREKVNRLKELNQATIEINAASLLNASYKLQQFLPIGSKFEHELIHGSRYKRWLHNPKLQGWLEKKVKETVARDVYIIEHSNGKELSFVYDCPIQQKMWTTGTHKGRNYAEVVRDCNVCKHYLEQWNSEIVCCLKK